MMFLNPPFFFFFDLWFSNPSVLCTPSYLKADGQHHEYHVLQWLHPHGEYSVLQALRDSHSSRASSHACDWNKTWSV